MLSTVFFNQSLNSTLIEALMVSTSNYEMRGSLFLGIDASFNLKFRIAVQTTALLKSLEAPHLIVRAISPIHETVIQAIGVDEIITPEKDFSRLYTAQTALGEHILQWYKVTETEHLYKVKAPALLVGQNLGHIDFEEHFHLRLVAIEQPEQRKNLLGLMQVVQQVIHPLSPDLTIEETDTLLLFGRIEAIERMGRL